MFDKILKAPLTMVEPKSSLPFSKKNYLPDNIIVTVFVSLKTVFNTTRKSVRYFALILTLETSVGMNHTK